MSAPSESAPAAPVLEARGVHRFYRRDGRLDNEVAALRDVTLSVDSGELVAVVGPSGSGKSTLLGLLAGLDDPSGGSVWVQGDRLSHRRPAEQARMRGANIGVLTQASGLLDHLDVLGNVMLAGTFRRPRPDPAQAAELLGRLGLSERRHARPTTLSGGETARANLAVALVGDPLVLLADEPTAEVSRAEEAAVLRLLTEHRPSHSATVVVTHSPAVARAADRVISLDDGRIGEPLVEATDLRIAFGSRSVLEGVDLSLDAGAELALVGRSGSGKSTLLLLLAGLLRPDRGEIRWPGLSEDPQERRAQLGLVFQAPSLLSELTAEQNVALPLRLRGTSREAAYEAAGRALDQLGLADAATALPDELSGGQQQRVALARALAGDPLVLLADEPTGALDSETARRWSGFSGARSPRAAVHWWSPRTTSGWPASLRTGGSWPTAGSTVRRRAAPASGSAREGRPVERRPVAAEHAADPRDRHQPRGHRRLRGRSLQLREQQPGGPDRTGRRPRAGRLAGPADPVGRPGRRRRRRGCPPRCAGPGRRPPGRGPGAERRRGGRRPHDGAGEGVVAAADLPGAVPRRDPALGRLRQACSSPSRPPPTWPWPRAARSSCRGRTVTPRLSGWTASSNSPPRIPCSRSSARRPTRGRPHRRTTSSSFRPSSSAAWSATHRPPVRSTWASTTRPCRATREPQRRSWRGGTTTSRSPSPVGRWSGTTCRRH